RQAAAVAGVLATRWRVSWPAELALSCAFPQFRDLHFDRAFFHANREGLADAGNFVTRTEERSDEIAPLMDCCFESRLINGQPHFGTTKKRRRASPPAPLLRIARAARSTRWGPVHFSLHRRAHRRV